MFEIKPNALYSKSELAKNLKGLCHVETFLRRVQPRHALKNVFFGADILEALHRLGGGADEASPDFEASARIGVGRTRTSGKIPRIDRDRIFKDRGGKENR